MTTKYINGLDRSAQLAMSKKVQQIYNLTPYIDGKSTPCSFPHCSISSISLQDSL